MLPLRAAGGDGPTSWQSSRWSFRGDRLFLLPGDSPLGFRLPLDSLPWEPEEARSWIYERDPLLARPPLTTSVPPVREPDVGQRRLGRARAAPAPAVDPAVVRTALCVEVREGVLHVFMPPLGFLEEFLALVAAVEDVARERDQPVRFEGYHPPHDHRLDRLSVTPDPGVLEVNVHPARSWQELSEITTALYEEAQLCRLGTEKFMLDGRHTGTGGGNHIVLGGATPADSPFLRRPDMLRSLIGYFVNHPSLSYLFSGLFVGPTSQAPRIDEARHDSIHELELAFAQVPQEGIAPPWLVDRIFRHLLVDLTGNTHRTEICIDKLYSPDSASGRQGLVELRAFEMPPHARMSLTQQLLLRALGAWFWRIPYRQRPVRWGTGLVDRFTLPHFVAQDFDDVLDDLGRAGYGFSRDWFTAHHEFRFPLCGQIAVGGIELSLRQAIEPWHVLGRAAGGRIHRALCRLVPRAPGGQGTGNDGLAPCRRLPGPTRAAASDGRAGRDGRRRALSRLASSDRRAPPDDRCARAAGVRRHRQLERARDRRLHLPRLRSQRPRARTGSHERARGGGASHRAFLRLRSHARSARSAARGTQSRLPADARSPTASAALVTAVRESFDARVHY